MKFKNPRYPHGRISSDDQGELRIAIAADPVQKVIRIEFGKDIRWLGFDPDAARAFAKMINDKVNDLEKHSS